MAFLSTIAIAIYQKYMCFCTNIAKMGTQPIRETNRKHPFEYNPIYTNHNDNSLGWEKAGLNGPKTPFNDGSLRNDMIIHKKKNVDLEWEKNTVTCGFIWKSETPKNWHGQWGTISCIPNKKEAKSEKNKLLYFRLGHLKVYCERKQPFENQFQNLQHKLLNTYTQASWFTCQFVWGLKLWRILVLYCWNLHYSRKLFSVHSWNPSLWDSLSNRQALFLFYEPSFCSHININITTRCLLRFLIFRFNLSCIAWGTDCY